MKNKKIVTTNVKTGVNQSVSVRDIEKAVNKILTKKTRAASYGDELNYEDTEPGIVLDEGRN
jgi:hypothetical protein